MTEYTSTKRALQKLGFKVVRRLGDRDVILKGHGYAIRIAAGYHLEGRWAPYVKVEDCGYAAVDENSQPVSWHIGSRRCNSPGKWVGENYSIEVTPEDELKGIEEKLFRIMYSLSHAGHHVTNLDNAW